jgi:hypothetical protein
MKSLAAACVFERRAKRCTEDRRSDGVRMAGFSEAGAEIAIGEDPDIDDRSSAVAIWECALRPGAHRCG